MENTHPIKAAQDRINKELETIDDILQNLKKDPLFYSHGSTTEEQYFNNESRPGV